MVYFLSDAHLGSRALPDRQAHQTKVINLLQTLAQDATAIYLLGDMFDFWYEYIYPGMCFSARHSFIPCGKRFYLPFLDSLKDITDRGVRVHFFTGNHDIWTFGRLARMTGIKVHTEPLQTVINGKTVFLAHGDGLIPSYFLQILPPDIQKKIRSFMRLRAFFHNPVAQFLFRFVPPFLGDAFGYEWARRSRLKELKHPCPYKGENKEELVLFAKEREEQADSQNDLHADYYIFGHRHIELSLPIPSSRVIILGDMFRQFTYARMDNNGEITLQHC